MGQREAKYQPVTTKLFSAHAGLYSCRAALQNIPLASQSQLSGPLTFAFLSRCAAADLHTPRGYFKRMSSQNFKTFSRHPLGEFFGVREGLLELRGWNSFAAVSRVTEADGNKQFLLFKDGCLGCMEPFFFSFFFLGLLFCSSGEQIMTAFSFLVELVL